MNNKSLVVLGCLHVGMDVTDYNLIERYIRWIKTQKSDVLLLGDNLENALPHKKSMMFSQVLNPQQQFDMAVKLLKPIASQIIGASTSNHSARSYEVAGIDLDKMLADQLGYISVYHPYQGFIARKVGKVVYKIAFTHGNGTSKNVFGDCARLLRNYPQADLCASSHSHCLATMQDAYLEPDRAVHPVTFVVTGSALNYARYADEAGYAPKPKGFAILWLDEQKKSIRADVSGILP